MLVPLVIILVTQHINSTILVVVNININFQQNCGVSTRTYHMTADCMGIYFLHSLYNMLIQL